MKDQPILETTENKEIQHWKREVENSFKDAIFWQERFRSVNKSYEVLLKKYKAKDKILEKLLLQLPEKERKEWVEQLLEINQYG